VQEISEPKALESRKFGNGPDKLLVERQLERIEFIWKLKIHSQMLEIVEYRRLVKIDEGFDKTAVGFRRFCFEAFQSERALQKTLKHLQRWSVAEHA
jgi:hypothetical protein